MQTHSDEKSTRLIAFAISHYCEKARWALERLSIPFIAECHMPGFHWLYTRPIGGKSVPVLVTEADTLTDSTDILHYLDAIAPVSKRLYPADPNLRREVEELSNLFDTQLGSSVRCWAYFYLFNNRELMRKLWCEGVPHFESRLFPIVFPLVSSLARRKYNITADSAASSLDKIKSIFETVNQRLAEGRSYLIGDNFSAADLTFACLAAPIVRPPEYRGKKYEGKQLSLHELPNEMILICKELRKTPAGEYALRLFREERRPMHQLS